KPRPVRGRSPVNCLIGAIRRGLKKDCPLLFSLPATKRTARFPNGQNHPDWHRSPRASVAARPGCAPAPPGPEHFRTRPPGDPLRNGSGRKTIYFSAGDARSCRLRMGGFPPNEGELNVAIAGSTRQRMLAHPSTLILGNMVHMLLRFSTGFLRF